VKKPQPKPPEVEETEPVSVGEILELMTDEPSLPGFEMDDTPIPTPLARSYTEATNERAKTQGTVTQQGLSDERPGDAQEPVHGEILPPSRPGSEPRYESRIRILDAWQYTGSVATAPAYVDRNWIGYADDRDVARNLDPGPCLRVPLTPDPDERTVTICRVGDYVVHEEIVGDDGRLNERVEVWEKNQFRRLFLPSSVMSNPPN